MDTELARSVPPDELKTLVGNRQAKTPAAGAATSMWCATSPTLVGMGGVYCEDVDIGEPVAADSKELRGVRPWIMDRELAARLWEKTEAWTGVRFAGG